MIELHQAYLGVRKRLYDVPKPIKALPKPDVVVVSPFHPKQLAPEPTVPEAAKFPPVSPQDFASAHEIADELAHDVPQSPKRPPPIGLIKHIVATEFDVSVLDLKSKRQTAEIVRPRQIAMYLARQMRPDSFPTIGRRFGGRDHTTSLHAVNKIAAEVASDPTVAETIAAIKAKIEARA